MRSKTTLIIPALNEQDTIACVIAGAKPHVDEIIVVSDGSTDKTAELARKAGAVVLEHRTNKGYDASVNDGFALAAKRGAQVFITFDADGQHDAQDIPKFIAPIASGEADFVIGRRQHKQRLTEHVFGWYSWLKMRHDDPLCGLKAFSRQVYYSLGYFDRLGTIGTQLQFHAAKRGFRMKKVAVHIRERADTPRFATRFRGNWKIFKAFLKIAWRY